MADVRGARRVELDDPRFICALLEAAPFSAPGEVATSVPPTPPGAYEDIAASNGYVCAVHTDGRLECWG